MFKLLNKVWVHTT